MASFNRVLLLGNLTRDPELTYLPSQTPVVEFGLATNRRWRGQDGEQREEVCFVDCRVFGRQAEVINQYCHKGKPLFIEGHLRLDQWTAQDGGKRSKLYVVVDNFQLLGGPSEGRSGGSSGGGGGGGRRRTGGDYDQGSQQRYGGDRNADDGGSQVPQNDSYDAPSEAYEPPDEDDIPF